MNIALFIDTVAFAGTERHVLDLGKSLARTGAAVVIACPAASPLTPRCMAAGLAMLDVPSSLRHAARTVRILAGELRSGRVDIIHAHNGRTHLLAVAAVKLAGRGRVVATQHFLAPNRTGRRGPKAWLAAILHRWAEKNTAAFIAISQAVKDQMLIRGDARAEKITVVHNGTPEPEKTSAERIAALRAELGVGDALMIFCAARLQKEKDIPTLIKAVGALRFNDHGSRITDQKRGDDGGGGGEVTGDGLQGTDELGVRSEKLEDCDAGEFTTKAQRHEGGGDDPQITRITQIDDAGKFTTEVGEVTEAENIECTANTAITACTEDSNSYLLTNFFPKLLIAGEGDQRGECERLIAAAGDEVTGDRLQVTGRIQNLESRTLNTGALRQASPARPTESAALPENSRFQVPGSSFSSGIRLLGFRSDVSALMAACDIFVLPAPAEPFGLVIIEAMALGKPVIAAGAGGPLEIVADGETGLLFAPGNSDSLAAGMKRLLTDADLRKRMGEAGRKRYEEMFTAQQMAEKMLAAYAATRRAARS